MLSPRMTERHPRQVELVMPFNRQVKAYRVGAANTLDTAFAGTTAMFDVTSGGTFRSPGIVGRRLGFTQYSNRNLTRAFYDPEDYWAGGGTLPHDADISFLRVREIALNGTAQPEGPILVVPPPGFFSNPRPTLSIVGTAPNIASLSTRLPPPGAMHIVLPRFADNLRVRVTDGADELLISFGAGQPTQTVPASNVETFYDGAVSELFLHSDGGTSTFEIRFAIVNCEMS